VQQEVFGDLVKSSYFEALAHEKLLPAGDPSIEPLEKGDNEGMGYVAVFEVMPEVQLKELDGLTITRPVVEVTDEDLEAMIQKLRKQRTSWIEVDREARVDDQVTIDFKGYIDDEAFEGGSAEGVPLVLGSNAMIEGFEEGLVGAKAGDHRTLDLAFPEDYRVEKLAGKDAKFEVTITKVAKPVIPELDEAFAKAFGVAEGGVDALYKEIRSNMERELTQKIQSLVKEQAMEGLLKTHDLEVPKALIDQEAKTLLSQAKDNMAQSGQSSNMELPVSLFEDQAKRRVSLGLIVSEIVRSNDIRVDPDRVRAKVEEFAQSYEDAQEVINYYYSNKNQLASVENVVLEDQVVDWVLDHAKVEESESGFDQLMNPQAENAPSSSS
jgi:trigger factor